MNLPHIQEERESLAAQTVHAQPPGAARAADIDISYVLRLHYELQKGAFVSEWEQTGDWLWVTSQVSPAPMWNHIACLDGRSRAPLDAAAQLNRQRAKSRRQPTIYLVLPPKDEIQFEQTLLEQELTKCDQESWMFYRGTAPLPSRPTPGLEIRMARTRQELKDFTAVFCAAYRTTGTKYAELFQRENVREAGFPESRHYIVYAHHQPVAVASVISLRDHACIYNVGTAPSARKKGYAGHLIQHIIQETQGIQTLFLQAEKGSPAERLYLQLGFVIGFTRHGYRLSNWSAPKQPQLSAHERSSAPQEYLSAVYRESALSEETATWAEAKHPLPAALTACLNQDSGGLRPILTAAWSLLLSRYSRERSVRFGWSDHRTHQISPVSVEVDESQRAHLLVTHLESVFSKQSLP